jgi:hypothetical protein
MKCVHKYMIDNLFFLHYFQELLLPLHYSLFEVDTEPGKENERQLFECQTQIMVRFNELCPTSDSIVGTWDSSEWRACPA